MVDKGKSNGNGRPKNGRKKPKNGKPVGQAKAGTTQDGRTSRGTFATGFSGNPQGMRKGYASKVTQELHQILDSEDPEDKQRTRITALMTKVVDLAIAGDMVAAKLVLDRVLPATLQAQVNVGGMTANRAGIIFDQIGAEFERTGKIPALGAD